MSLGIDIHPYYQRDIRSWPAIRDQGVDWVYVKASDGSAAYSKTVNGVTYRPDTHVAGAKSVRIPVGVYHYAQFGDPVAQANVLIAQHKRLGATLPPMLDLEAPFEPNATARNFAVAFLNRVAQAGYRPVIYIGSSDARFLRPDQWGIPNLVIWIASYGPNDGRQHGLTGGYPGRVDIHQYTSVGRVAGINADVDLNQSYVDITEEDDMAAADVWKQTVTWTPPGATKPVTVSYGQLTLWDNYYSGYAAGMLDKMFTVLAANEANDMTPEKFRAMHEEMKAELLAALESAVIDVDVTVGGKAVNTTEGN